MSDSRPTRVIVIGAGWAGLIAARTYLKICSSELNPKRHPISLTILDDGTSPGGVWSRDRLYPGLIANSPNGLYEYSDFSMVDEKHLDLEIVSGERVQEYLEAYARRFNLYEKIRFGVTVTHVRRSGSGWNVETAQGEVLACDKLIVASGLHSKLNLPLAATVPTSVPYTGTSIHSKQLGRNHVSISTDPSVRDIVVVGGCKSAVEACSLFLDPSLSAPKRVHWVIRPSEQGVPLIVMDPDMRPNLVALSNARIFSVISPSIFLLKGFWYSFLHSGRWLMGTLFFHLWIAIMGWAVSFQTSYHSSRNGRNIQPTKGSFFKDVPYISVILKNSPFLKILHEDDPDKLWVHRANPIALEGRHMLVDEADECGHLIRKKIKADAVVWCTGWTPSIDFFDMKDRQMLGLPTLKTEVDEATEKEWTSIGRKTDAQVRKIFPYLDSDAAKPRLSFESIMATPFRLYKQCLPISCLPTANDPNADRSIAFTSFTSSSQTVQTAELCALWAVTWLEDLQPHQPPSRQEAMYQISMIQSWRSLRYGARGLRDPEIILEIQGFLDAICMDLEVNPERKRTDLQGSSHGVSINSMKNLFREWMEPYRSADYAGLADEFLNRRKCTKTRSV